MKRSAVFFLFLLTLPLGAQSAQPAAGPFKTLSFLEGTWEAKATGGQGVASTGTYTFRTELNNHILARHGSTGAGCKGPAGFDCDHNDLLYVFSDGPGQPLKAIYFDNEGHVIHYNVSTPDAATVVFLSDSSQPGPAFQLVYQRKDATMVGKFQMRMPGQAEWKSYLEWSGDKQPDK